MVLIATSALYFLADNEADNDLWVHLFTGRLILGSGAVPRVDDLSYTAAGLSWIDHEWLTEAAFAAAFDALGSTGLWLCKLALALLTAWLVWLPVARRSRSPWVRGPVMLLVLATLARGYAIRPQLITYLGIAALLAWLDRLEEARRRPAAWALVALSGAGFALWANAHGGFIVGLGTLGLFSAAPRFTADAAAPSAPLRLAMLAAASAAACLNPYGPALFAYLLAEMRAPHPLTEWQPVHPTDPAHAPFLLMLAALIATLPFARTLRRRPWWAALVAIVGAMAIRHQRHIPLFAVCAAAPLAEQVDAALGWLRARTHLRLSATAHSAIAVALVALALAQLGLLANRIRLTRGRIVYAAAEYPVGALRFLRERDVHGHLAVPLDWGGYALWHGAPAVSVSLDGRFATVYPPHVVEDNFAFFRGAAGSSGTRLLDAYDTTLVLVPQGVPTPLDGRPGWRLLYADSVAALFAKGGAGGAAFGDAPRGWLAFP
jgi:hypothetical protein